MMIDHFNHSIHKWLNNIVKHITLPSTWSFTVLYSVASNMVEQRPLEGFQFINSFPEFWNPLWPRLQRWPPDGDVSTHLQILVEPLLAGFWHRWNVLGWFLAILNIPMQIDITKSEWKMFSTHVWMCIYLDVDFYYYSKFGQIHTHKKPAWFLWSFSGFPHRFP